MRNDYFPLLQPLYESGYLPLLHPGPHTCSIAAFTEKHAREFFQNSRLEITPDLMDEIFQQMVEIEPDAGLFRPITLNMMGLFLERRAIREHRTIVTLRENFLEDHLEQCIRREDVREHAPIILKRMITRRGTNKARSVANLSNETHLPASIITGCLASLEEQGIVRLVDEEENVWEISHDVIAQLTKHVLERRIRISTASKFFLASVLPVAVSSIFLFLPHDIWRSAQLRLNWDRIISKKEIVRYLGVGNGYVLGVDASHFDGKVDWGSVKHWGAHFAFVKATEGATIEDRQFRRNWQEIKAAGLARGAYHYFSFYSDPKEQAQAFARVVGPLEDTDLPPVISFFGPIILPPGVNFVATTQAFQIFAEEVERLFRRRPIVCAGDFWRVNMRGQDYSRYPLWLRVGGDTNLQALPGWTNWTFRTINDPKIDGARMKGLAMAIKFDVFHGTEADLRSFIAASRM